MKDSLIGINEGIEELTLTLLIGIKADLLQFQGSRVQGSCLFVTYTIIQGIISSEM